MRKRDELTKGCMAKAREGEMTFVLLGRDRAAPIAIIVWAVVRVLIRKNRWRDPQIQEAIQCARTMRAERKAARPSGPVHRGGGIVEGMAALREAGGKAWDGVADPEAYLRRNR